MQSAKMYAEVVLSILALIYAMKVESMPQMLPSGVGNSQDKFLQPLLTETYLNCSALCLSDFNCVGITIFQVKVITEHDPIFWCRTDVDHKQEDTQKGTITYSAILRDRLPKVVRNPVAKPRFKRDYNVEKYMDKQNAYAKNHESYEYKPISNTRKSSMYSTRTPYHYTSPTVYNYQPQSHDFMQSTTKRPVYYNNYYNRPLKTTYDQSTPAPALFRTTLKPVRVAQTPYHYTTTVYNYQPQPHDFMLSTTKRRGYYNNYNRPLKTTYDQSTPAPSLFRTTLKPNFASALANPDVAQLTIVHTIPALVEALPQVTQEVSVPNQPLANAQNTTYSLSRVSFSATRNGTVTSVTSSDITHALENLEGAQLTIEQTVPALVESEPQETEEISVPVSAENQANITSPQAMPSASTPTPSNGATVLENTTSGVEVLEPPSLVSNGIANTGKQTNPESQVNRTIIGTLNNTDNAQLTIEHIVPAVVDASPQISTQHLAENMDGNIEPLQSTLAPSTVRPEGENSNASMSTLMAEETTVTPTFTSFPTLPPSTRAPALNLTGLNITAFLLSRPTLRPLPPPPANLTLSQLKNLAELKNSIKTIRPIAGSNIIFEEPKNDTEVHGTSLLQPLTTTSEPETMETPGSVSTITNTILSSTTTSLTPILVGQEQQMPGTTDIPPNQMPGTTDIPKEQITETTDIPKEQTTGTTDIPKEQTTGTTDIPKEQMTGTTNIPLETEFTGTTIVQDEDRSTSEVSTPMISAVIDKTPAATSTPDNNTEVIISEVFLTPSTPRRKFPFMDVGIPTTATRNNIQVSKSKTRISKPPIAELLEGIDTPTFGSTDIPPSEDETTQSPLMSAPAPWMKPPFHIEITDSNDLNRKQQVTSRRRGVSDKECLFSDRERFKRDIVATAYAKFRGEPTLLTFVDKSDCVGEFSKTGKKELKSKSKLFPDFPFPQKQVHATAFYNDTLFLFDNDKDQKVWRFSYDSSTQAFRGRSKTAVGNQNFLREVCGITGVRFDIRAVVQFSSSDASCILFDSSRNLLLSPFASENARSLANVIVATMEAEFVNGIEGVFAWLDEPEVSYIYIFGSNKEVYEIYRDSTTNFKWKRGSYRIVPYEDFPYR